MVKTGRPMKRVCAWCGRVLEDGPPHPVSHGICEECAKQIQERLEMSISEQQPLYLGKCRHCGARVYEMGTGDLKASGGDPLCVHEWGPEVFEHEEADDNTTHEGPA